MTEKKDFTSIHDLGEFEHAEDPETDAQFSEEDNLEDEFLSKTTVTSLSDLDDDAAFENEFDPNESDEPNDSPESFEEFSYSESDSTDEFATESLIEDDNESSTGQFDTDTFSEDQFSMESNEEFDSLDSYNDDNSDGITEENIEDNNDSDPEADPEEHPEVNEEDSFEFGSEPDLDSDLDSPIDSELDSPIDSEIETETEQPEFPDQQLHESFEDQMQVVMPAKENYGHTTLQNSQASLSSIGSLGSDDIQNYTQQQMQEVAENISAQVPEVPRVITTYDDLKREVKNLSYAPSPEGTGPLFAIQIQGQLAHYKDHIQSILDEFQIQANLSERTYFGPLQAGLIQISRISEYVTVQVTNALSKYGISVKTFYLEDIISSHEDMEELESRGLESEFNLPQNLQDHAEFAPANDWPEDDILITTTSGPKGYKVLKRCGVTQKIITLSRQDFKNLQVNINKFFNNDVHLSGSSTLLDGLIKKVYEELKEDAREKGANCMVNFKLEQTMDIHLAILHFSADLLYLRKLHVYRT